MGFEWETTCNPFSVRTVHICPQGALEISTIRCPNSTSTPDLQDDIYFSTIVKKKSKTHKHLYISFFSRTFNAYLRIITFYNITIFSLIQTKSFKTEF